MLQNTDQIFEEFINTFFKHWESKLNNVKYILSQLQNNIEELKELKIENIIKPEELIENQRNWVLSCMLFTEKKKEFFKPYWVPLQKGDSMIFIDISDANYPVFDISISFVNNLGFNSYILFDKANDLLRFKELKINRQKLNEKMFNKVIEHVESHNEKENVYARSRKGRERV